MDKYNKINQDIESFFKIFIVLIIIILLFGAITLFN
jgi:Sec-independent protein translocase protein TatA